MNVKQIHVLRLDNEKEPFQKWFKKLDKMAKAIITSYIHRIASGGGQKNIKALGDGIYEIKINYASGYRVYFGNKKSFIMLLLGGNKKTQRRDINTAKEYWRTYYEKK